MKKKGVYNLWIVWIKKALRTICILLCLICSLPHSASASAPTSPDGGRVITITQEELTSLQQIFSELSSSNQLSQKRYSELLALSNELNSIVQALQKESASLKTELETSKQEQQKALEQQKKTENLLNKANESLQKYNAEMKKQQRRLKAERNIAIGVATAAVIMAACK